MKYLDKFLRKLVIIGEKLIYLLTSNLDVKDILCNTRLIGSLFVLILIINFGFQGIITFFFQLRISL